MPTMETFKLNTLFGEEPAHIEISAPMGAGNVYHVIIDKYYNGQIINTSRGWQVYLNPKTILQGDDVSVILELIEDRTNTL